METMAFGRDQADWDLLAEAGEEFLIERARLGRLTSYVNIQVSWRIIENSIRKNRDRRLRGRNQETCGAAAYNR
jgi:hypothetical protein